MLMTANRTKLFFMWFPLNIKLVNWFLRNAGRFCDHISSIPPVPFLIRNLQYFHIYGNIESMDTKTAVTQLSAIAQEARLEIFRLLVQAGNEGLPAGSIGEKLQIPASTLSFHLKELNHAGLINSRQESRFIYYSASYGPMNDLLAYLTENCCAGDQHCHTLPACNPADVAEGINIIEGINTIEGKCC